MNWELDHVFFATANAGEVEQSLAEFGLMFTARRVHAGRGPQTPAPFSITRISRYWGPTIVRSFVPTWSGPWGLMSEFVGAKPGPVDRSLFSTWRLKPEPLSLAVRDLGIRTTLRVCRESHSHCDPSHAFHGAPRVHLDLAEILRRRVSTAERAER